MDTLLDVLPIILYSLGIILLIVLIILSVKLIHTVDKTNKILDDAYNKTKSLNGIFNAIDKVTDALSNISDSLVGAITSGLNKVFVRKKKNKKKEDEDDE